MRFVKNKSASWGFVLLVVTLVMLAWVTVSAAPAAPITVNSTADSGSGTLREALTTAGSGDTIVFDTAVFPPGTPATISLTSPLPGITQGNLTIDGTGAGVILDGSGTPADTVGISITSNGNAVKGLQILSFPDAGVAISGGAKNNTIGGDMPEERNIISGNGGNGVLITGSDTTSNTVSGNYIGTDVTGTAALANGGHGVEIVKGAKGNTIGGSTGGERNVISGNESYGIRIGGEGVDGNVVSGNYIGVDATGLAALGNDGDGVIVACGAKNNRVGGATAGERNVISANGCFGGGLGDPGTNGNVVGGNYIGVDAAGTAALGNGCEGVVISDGPQNNIVGGDTPAERNVISGNESHGVLIAGSDTTSNTVSGNYVGTDVNGTAALANRRHGVVINNSAHDNVIGGSSPGEGNLISGNTYDGVRISGFGAEGNVVIGNQIGLDSSGTAVLGNGEHGVEIVNGAARNTVGGMTAGERNVVSGNAYHGVTVGDPGGDENVVSGNYIGTDTTGVLALGNGNSGVRICWGAQDNLIGGTSIEQGNLIAHNTEAGVLVEGAGSTGNTISHNAITANGGLGIDNMSGGNTELTPPTIASAGCSSVSGTAPLSATVEIFSDPADEGRRYEGTTTADATGVFTWTGSVSGPNVTATATDGAGNTSEFSAPLGLVCYRVYLPLVVSSSE